MEFLDVSANSFAARSATCNATPFIGAAIAELVPLHPQSTCIHENPIEFERLLLLSRRFLANPFSLDEKRACSVAWSSAEQLRSFRSARFKRVRAKKNPRELRQIGEKKVTNSTSIL